jgi:hypothetical protein
MRAALGSFRKPERVVLLLLALFALAASWRAGAPAPGIDFYQFWAVGQALEDSDAADIYSDAGRQRVAAKLLDEASRSAQSRRIEAAEQRRVLETYSTPFLYAVFGFFSTGDYETDLQLYRFLLLTCLAVSIALLCRLVGASLELALAAVIVFSVWYAPFQSDLRVGNVNATLLLLLSVYLAIVSRWRSFATGVVGGAILGLAVAFKPIAAFVVGLLVAWWIVTARPRVLAAHAIGGGSAAITAFALSSASFRSAAAWCDWSTALRNLPADIITLEMGNVGLVRLIGDVVGVDSAIPLTVGFSALAIGGLWLARDAAESGSRSLLPEALIVGLGSLIPLLGSRLAWLHYFVLTIPMLLILLRPLEPGARLAGLAARRLVPALAIALLARIPLQSIDPDLGSEVQAAFGCAATLLLFAAGLRELRELGRSSPPAGSTPH